MGEIEVVPHEKMIVIHSDFFFYGNHATEELCNVIVHEIDEMWNEPNATIFLEDIPYRVKFSIQGYLYPQLSRQEVEYSSSLRNNYIRIEEFSKMEVSYVDKVFSNSGYFVAKNIERGSTTAAHEYGHMLGLVHPEDLDIRGKGRPSIMYPRGTLVDARYQWVLQAQAGAPGGTINPFHRRVSVLNILDLQIPSIIQSGKNYIGDYTNLYHEAFSTNT